MYCILACALVICLLWGRPTLVAQLPHDGAYLSRERTSMINGLFIWIVFMAHLQTYQSPCTAGDIPVLAVVGRMGQTMVAPFFFFSGYGIMSSLQRKGLAYSKQLVTQRFSKVLFHFAVAVGLFWAVQYALGIHYDTLRVLRSFCAWSSIGNSNWFIFVSLVAYVMIALSYACLHRWGHTLVVGGVAAAFLGVIPLLLPKGGYWVDSCLCIPAGMLFCLYQGSVEKKVRAIPCPVWLLGGVVALVGWGLYRVLTLQLTLHIIGEVPPLMLVLVQNVGCVVFSFGVCFFFAGMRFARTPAFLVWSGGVGLFYLYIFQRIPMLVGKHWGWQVEAPLLYQMACAICTVLVAWGCCRVFPRVDACIWRK